MATLFAPTDEAIMEVAPTEEALMALLADTAKLADILTYHVIVGE